MSFVLRPGVGGVDLVVTGDWTAAARDALLEGRADGLVLNYALGFWEQPIDFIKGLPLRRLELLARSVTDLSPVYSLGSTLERLWVTSDPRAEIELGNLPRLKATAANWSQLRAAISLAPQLEELYAGGYSAPNLEPLTKLTGLRSLTMKERPRLQSLDGMEAFGELRQLGMFGAFKLDDITALARSSLKTLEVLELEGCRKVPDVAPVAGCTSLIFFNLAEGGEIPSVTPLGGLVNLERLHLYDTTRVMDGDLSPIAGLPKLTDFRMMNRREYSPSVQSIEEAIERRSRPRWQFWKSR